MKTDLDYSRRIQELKHRYRRSQIKAAAHVNQEMLRFYWSIGRDIVSRDAENVYGSGVYRNLSQDLKEAIPDANGFSRQNLLYMKKMYLVYNDRDTNSPQLVGHSEEDLCQQPVGTSEYKDEVILFSVPWGHHRLLIDKYFEKRERETALFYIHKVVEDVWSRNILKSFIDTNFHLRQEKAVSSFSRLLPTPEIDIAQELTKDPYIFDFTQMTEPYRERELKKALMANISRFLLELGSGFAYVGEEYRLKVEHTEQFIDLLFYNIRLHAYCVIEVKTATFGPGDIGQLGTYMTAVNHILKTEHDNPTIGLLICKDKDNVLAQYALALPPSQSDLRNFNLRSLYLMSLRVHCLQ